MDTVPHAGPRLTPSLDALPFDILVNLAQFLDLVTIARLRLTCRSLANPAAFAACLDFQLLWAVTTLDPAAFTQTLAKCDQGDILVSDTSDLPHMRRRRSLLQACMWQLVNIHDQGSSLWWAPLNLLFDRTKVYFRGTHEVDKVHGVGDELVSNNAEGCNRLDQMERAMEAWMERLVGVAVSRRHAVGLAAASQYCVRNHAWTQSLHVYDTLVDLISNQNGSTNHVDAGAVSHSQSLNRFGSLDMQVALLPLTWFAFGPENGYQAAGALLASSGHPLFALHAVTVFTNNCMGSLRASFYSMVEPVYFLYAAGHHTLTHALLTLYLYALGTHGDVPQEVVRTLHEPLSDMQLMDIQETLVSHTQRKLVVSFPGSFSDDALEAYLFQPFTLAGAQPRLIRAAMSAMRTHWPWADLQDWFLLGNAETHPLDAGVLRWYLNRAYPSLDMIHNLSHTLAIRLSRTVSVKEGHSVDNTARIVQCVLDTVPLDFVYVGEEEMDSSASSCPRCKQLEQVAGEAHAPKELFRMVYPYNDNDERPIMRLVPSKRSALETMRLQKVLVAVVPPAIQGSPGGAASGLGWRAFLSGFVDLRLQDGYDPKLPHFWPHVRDADPSKSLNVIPFPDFMWAMVRGYWFEEAAKVLEEAKSLARFATWRITQAELAEVRAQVHEQGVDEAHRNGFLVFEVYLEDNGWVEESR